MIETLKNAFMGIIFALIVVISTELPEDDQIIPIMLIYILVGAFLSYAFIKD